MTNTERLLPAILLPFTSPPDFILSEIDPFRGFRAFKVLIFRQSSNDLPF